MAKRKLKMLLNVGFDDQKKYGIPDGSEKGLPPLENDVISVDEQTASILVNGLKLAKEYDPSEDAEQETEEADSDVPQSPVKDAAAPDAIEQISRMTSREKLEAIVAGDTRVTVQNAAKQRLSTLPPA